MRVGCHRAAMVGKRVAKLLVPDARRPEQKGHPLFALVR